LADDVKECGQSGVVYTKQDILNNLPNEEPKALNTKDCKVKSFNATVYRVPFKTLEESMPVLRSLMWQCIDGRLHMVCHQDTVIHAIPS
jgi:hypothetical protein